MKWMKFKIKTITDAEDIIISTLYDIGLEGAQIEDKVPLTAAEKEQMFVDILPDGPEDDGIAYLSFFVEEKEDGSLEVCGEKKTPEQIMKEVTNELEELRTFMDIGEGSVSVDETEDIDWINNWKQYFHQFTIDDVLVIPSWEEVQPEDQNKMILHIDPGTAFGTGMHHTTRLCITQMKKYLKEGQKLFDVGCGSGILSIIGLMLGAGEAMATDVDPNAVSAAIENARVNHINMNQYDVKAGDIITDVDFRHACGDEKYDLVLANILADVIIPLSGVIKDNMKPGALFVSSGIINTKEDDVREALLANGFEILEVTHSGDWVAFTARK